MADPVAPMIVGRYVLHAPIARGGMATIHLARLLGAEGFSRLVAAKRLHPELIEEAEIVEMLLDEARIASKIHHPNVVPVLDVVRSGREVVLFEEYVHGLPLDKLLRSAQTGERLPPAVVVAIGADMLAGLSAAHEAKDEIGTSLGIVHRDVSPQNVIVGVDGIARLIDFGVAKAVSNAHVTRVGVFKGKLAYSAPEQIRGTVTVASDVYAAGVVLWEVLAGRRAHPGLKDVDLVAAVVGGEVDRLTTAVDWTAAEPDDWEILERLEPVLMKAMDPRPSARWASAAEMRTALLAAAAPATAAEVSRWVRRLGKEFLEGRERLIVSEESSWRQRATAAPPDDPPTPGGATVATIRPSVTEILAPVRRSTQALAVAVGVVGVLLATILVMLVRRPEVAPLGVMVVSSAPPPPAVVPAAASPAIVPPPAPSAPPPASASAEPAPSASAPARLRPRADCRPAFTFSADGKRILQKPGCP